jgi:hypothetical protein
MDTIKNAWQFGQDVAFLWPIAVMVAVGIPLVNKAFKRADFWWGKFDELMSPKKRTLMERVKALELKMSEER